MHDAGAPVDVLRDGVIMLGAALLFVLIFRRLGLGAVLGYLIAGIVIGPYGFALVGDAESKLGFADFGITLLLFLVGLELNPRRIWRLKGEIFGLGLIQVVLCGVALSLMIRLATPFSTAAAIALGLPLALSSTAQVLPMLRSAGRLNTPFGERAFSILLFQDLSIVPLITIVAVLSRAPSTTGSTPGWLLAAETVGAITGLVLVGRYILNPLFRLIGGLGEREMFVAAGLFTVLASAAVMEWLHLSTALGAFIAGVMLADSPYRHELEADVEPFRTILLGLFFLSIGMMLAVPTVLARPWFVIGIAAGVVVVKAGIMFGVGRLFRMKWREALSLGLLLSQGGEFGFVLFAQAKNALLIAPEAASLFGAIVTLSMATTPFLMEIARRTRTRETKRDDLDGPEKSETTRVIIVGYGRFGQTVGQMLAAKRISVTLIDKEPELIDISGSFGTKVYYGDGTRIDLLRQAGAEEAEAILFCHDGEQLKGDALTAIIDTFPGTKIFIRAFDRRHLIDIDGAAVTGTVREVFESAIRLARDVMDELGVTVEEVNRTEERYRKRDGERLRLQAATGDLRAAAETMFRPSSQDGA